MHGLWIRRVTTVKESREKLQVDGCLGRAVRKDICSPENPVRDAS